MTVYAYILAQTFYAGDNLRLCRLLTAHVQWKAFFRCWSLFFIVTISNQATTFCLSQLAHHRHVNKEAVQLPAVIGIRLAPGWSFDKPGRTQIRARLDTKGIHSALPSRLPPMCRLFFILSRHLKRKNAECRDTAVVRTLNSWGLKKRSMVSLQV